MAQPVFPRWSNTIRPLVLVVLLASGCYVTVLVYYGFSPKTISAGYAPIQPVPYSHALHAGKLGLDCRYCHSTVERSAKAGLPPTATCMNCHATILRDSKKLEPIRQAAASGMPMQWVRVHNLPDYAYFDHSAHVTRGIGCVACHGRVDQMDIIRQVSPLSMGWCLTCHRNPDPNLRPPEYMTRMEPMPDDPAILTGTKYREAHHIHPSTSCSTCHR